MKTILAILTLVSSATTLFAQSLVDKVPADAIVCLRWAGTDSLPASFDKTHLKAVLDNSKIRELFTDFLPAVAQKIAASDRSAREPIALFQSLFAQVWRHPTVFYFAGVDMSNPRQPMPRVALACDAGKDSEALYAQLSGLLGRNPVVHILRDANIIVVAAGYDQASMALAGGLSTSAAYTATMKQLQSDPVLLAYIDVEKGMSLIQSLAASDPQASVMFPKVITALGLNGLKRIAGSAGFDGQDWMTQSFVEAPAPRTGLMQGLDGRPVSPDLLKAIPADATFVATGRFDAAKLITNIRAAAAQIGPDAAQGVEMVLGAVQIALARNVVTDVLEPLGEDWAVYCSPSVSGNGFLGMVVVNKLDDPARARTSLPTAWVNLSNWATVGLRRAQAGIQLSGQMTEIDGQRIYYVGAPVIAPAWTIKDDYLYMGLFPQPVASGARWMARGAKSISSSEKVIALQKRLGVSNPCSFSFYDLPVVATQGSGYEQILAVARYGGFGDLFGIPMPEPLVPPLDVLQQHLTPAGSVAWVDDAGYHVKSIGPFPGSKLLSEQGMFAQAVPATGAIMASILLPSLNRARETANRVKCAANMKSIGLALIQDAADHRGQFPAKLSDLVRNEDIVGQVFVCPSGGTVLPPDVARGGRLGHDAAIAWVDANSDYVYLGAGKTTRMGADEILVYEKPGHHGNDGINILFGDGHVDFMRMNQAVQMIEQQAPAGQK